MTYNLKKILYNRTTNKIQQQKVLIMNECKDIIKINASNLTMEEISFTNTTNKFCKFHISFNTKTNMVHALRNIMVSDSGFYSMIKSKKIDLYTYDELIKEIKKYHKIKKINIKPVYCNFSFHN